MSNLSKHEGASFIDGFELSYNSATVLNIAAGSAGASDGSRVMTGAGTTIAITTNGAGGLLSHVAAAEASNTLYAVWMLEKDDGTQCYGFDTSFSSPTYPADYTKSRRIGCWLNDSSSNLFNFKQTGSGRTRRYDPTNGSFWTESDNSPCPSTPTTMQGPVNIERVVLFGSMSVNAADTAHHSVYLRSDTGSLMSLHVYTASNSNALAWTNKTDANGRMYYWAYDGFSLNVSMWFYVDSYEDYL